MASSATFIAAATKSQSKSEDHFSSLPPEALETIFCKLPFEALQKLIRVNKKMHCEVEGYLHHTCLTLTPIEKDATIKEALRLGWRKLFSMMYQPAATLSFENYKLALYRAAR